LKRSLKIPACIRTTPTLRRSGSKAQFTPKQYDAKNPASRGLDIIFGCTCSLLGCEARLNQEYKSVDQLS
jgi:hypothetical protein